MKHEGTFTEYIAELIERQFNLFVELQNLRWWQIIKHFETVGKIKQLKSDIKLASMYEQSQNK